ncbi:beta-ketoacyl synthase N-terminal-like domain-containing protein [Chromobacterium sp. IIBBL 290-4]|uniref:beta-ketoacyl synthase N-terminal-like domain-containing protein n=1 Tax=Chromobacterium sp. IIBBL 290-4 TaxID=2953890 RepID=UPI0020B89F6E|nr:beta-ketoacyl synthase N-terminal-like domain-containing protein [Chromobacterium sp. IIBBL 290-4]UTH76445.1 FAD-dependent monooxygenase [Chromobacterium sp. IIBBL 290-4]
MPKSILEALRDGRITLDEAKRHLKAATEPELLGKHIIGPAREELAAKQGDIAIISLAGRFPGAADVETFWENLKVGADSIIQVPNSRWREADYYSPDKHALGRSYCRWGGFIEDVDRFDPIFFKISPREAMLMDPQERILLEVVWTLFEHVGYTRARLHERYDGAVGVFTGSMYQQYQAFDTDPDKKATLAVSSHASMANRVSHFFDLRGPSIAVDSMCSSAATAIHLACESLRSGACQLAVAGAANLTIHPYKYVALSQAQLLARDPSVRAFGDTDGFLPAEVVGAVLLKPLAHALADNDPIVAVIKSTSISHKGYTPGFSVPNSDAMADLMRHNLASARVAPEAVDYVESSTSGAPLGDAAEFAALQAVFGARDPGLRPCVVGSVKANIGHPEAAAGIAQIIKVALQLRHRLWVPSIHALPLNPKIRFDGGALRLLDRLESWPAPPGAAPRRAAINTFAAGGSNSHMILEEYVEEADLEGADKTPGARLLVFSAASDERLVAVLSAMREHLQARPEVDFADLAYTLQLGRESMVSRLAMAADDVNAAVAKLEASIECLKGIRKEWPARCHFFNVESEAEDRDASARVVGGLDALAYRWVRGEVVDWQSCHTGWSGPRARRFLSLPTYPFQKVPCWVPEVRSESEPTVSVAAETQPERHTGANLTQKASIRELVLCHFGQLLQLDPQTVSVQRAMTDYGLNSVTKLVLVSMLCNTCDFLDLGRDGGRLAEAVTVAELIEYVGALYVPETSSSNTQVRGMAEGHGELGKEYLDYVVPDMLGNYRCKGYAFQVADSDWPDTPSTSSLVDGAVVVGGGPAGLIAALALKRGGVDQVAVVEKRTVFNRMQMITLYEHTLPYLKRAGILDAIVARSSSIGNHDFFAKFLGQRTKYYARAISRGVLEHVDADIDYTKEWIRNGFVGESVMAISLADLQDVLMQQALAQGIHFIADAEATVVAHDTDSERYRLRLDHSRGSSITLDPELIVIADGVRSRNAQAAGVRYRDVASPKGVENWYVFHCATDRRESALCYEFDFNREGVLENCAFGLFYPKRSEFGVALYMRQNDPPSLALLQDKAAFFAAEQQASFEGIQWVTNRIPVRFTAADRLAMGNVLLVGDAAGTGSPIAGLGTGLAISAYGWGVEDYCRRAAKDRADAILSYQDTASEYVTTWHVRSQHIWGDIDALPGAVTRKADSSRVLERASRKRFGMNGEGVA